MQDATGQMLPIGLIEKFVAGSDYVHTRPKTIELAPLSVMNAVSASASWFGDSPRN